MSADHSGCSDAMKKQLAEFYRDVALMLFGKASRDRVLLAEMSVTGSIADIVHAENIAKKELTVIADRVRVDGTKNRSLLKDLLLRSRMLRGNMALMAKKRMGMEQHLETLRQSQLNQNMLLSMKHTSDALQTMGMKLSDADTIVLDLEDTTGDINSLQTALSSSFASADFSDDDLHAELELLLADDLSLHDVLRKPENKQQPQSKNDETAGEVVVLEALSLEATVPEHEQVVENQAAIVDENSETSVDEKSLEDDRTQKLSRVLEKIDE